jgi:hypothetical protein
MPDEPESYPPCRCGREVRKLNAASDTPKCVGCGYTRDDVPALITEIRRLRALTTE